MTATVHALACSRAGCALPAHGSDVPHENADWRWRDGEAYGRAEPLTETAKAMYRKTGAMR